MDLSVGQIERIWVNVPYRPVPARNMVRELPHWTIFELCLVTLACGVRGVGETMQFYTWGNTTDEAVRRAQGRAATELMWDDSLGAGLQMALFDAVGRALDVHIGVAMGQVVASTIGTDHHRQYSITGDSVNLAARLTSRAQNGEILQKTSEFARTGGENTAFGLTQPKGLKPGTYKVVVLLNDDSVDTKVFVVKK